MLQEPLALEMENSLKNDTKSGNSPFLVVFDQSRFQFSETKTQSTRTVNTP